MASTGGWISRHERSMNHRFACLDDVAILAEMNRQLIEDEGHRNSMTVEELDDRMRRWLLTDYQAVVFQQGTEALGYALFKQEPDWLYLRQFFVRREKRRQGIGRNAITWLLKNVWRDAKRIRLDVLVGNSAAIQFWRSVGFADYCLTMEREWEGDEC